MYVQLLLLVGAKLEHIITRLAQEVDDEKAKGNEARVKPSDEHFWFRSPSIILYLIHFILFQNSFEIAFFFWIWVSKKNDWTGQMFFCFCFSLSNLIDVHVFFRAHMDSILASWKKWATSSQDF